MTRRAVAALALAAWCVAALALLGCGHRGATDRPLVRAPATRLPPAQPPARFTVVSFNVHLGRDPAAVARALRDHGLGDADVYLIQEIEDRTPDEPRARAVALAAELGVAVVYAPARAPADDGEGTHGVAILSRWPITTDAVVGLPYHELLWRSRPRIALGVVVDVAGTPVQVWNVHLDTRIAVESRRAQLAPVFEAARREPALAIVGGDVNTWGEAHEDAVDDLARAEGFDTPTAHLSDTVSRRVAPFRVDAIYSRGFEVLAGGVVREVAVSDHRPIWAQLGWPSGRVSAR